MSADSIFSSSSKGDAPANPFASLGSDKVQSPFAAVGKTEQTKSPFGFEEEKKAEEVTKLPEKRPSGQGSASGLEENPFQSAGTSASPAPAAESKRETTRPASAEMSPFAQSGGFDAPAPPSQSSQDFSAPAPPVPHASESKPAPPQEPVAAAPGVSQAASSSNPLGAASPTPSSGSSPAAAPAAFMGGGMGKTKQLELRAIFGVEDEMTREEILQRAKNLPGIRDVAVVGPGEMSAIQTLGGVMSRFGYGDTSSWQMTCSGGVVDFVSGEKTTLAVLREGRYSAGVWETLMIVARELGQM